MGRTDTGKDPDAGKDWRQEEKGTIEDKMGGWHHWPRTWVRASSGVGDGQGALQSIELQSQICLSNWTERMSTFLSLWPLPPYSKPAMGSRILISSISELLFSSLLPLLRTHCDYIGHLDNPRFSPYFKVSLLVILVLPTTSLLLCHLM